MAPSAVNFCDAPEMRKDQLYLHRDGTSSHDTRYIWTQQKVCLQIFDWDVLVIYTYLVEAEVPFLCGRQRLEK